MDELTVRENVEYPARLRRDLDRRRPLVDDLLERLGLAHLQDRPPTETSLGEQQRTAVARAVVLRPTLIVADEPTAHQDAGWASAVLATLGDAVVAGSGCIVATHDPDVLGSVDRVVGSPTAASTGRCGREAFSSLLSPRSRRSDTLLACLRP